MQVVELVNGVIAHRRKSLEDFYNLLCDFSKKSCRNLLRTNPSFLLSLNDFQQEVAGESYVSLSKNDFSCLQNFCKQPKNFPNYLSTTVRHKALEVLKEYRPEGVYFSSIQENLEEVESFGETVTMGETFLGTQELIRMNLLRQAIDKLPTQQRRVMTAWYNNYFGAKNLDERVLAQQLGMKPTSFARNKSVAVRNITELLYPYRDVCYLDAA